MTPNEALPRPKVFSSGNEFQLDAQSNGNLVLIDTATSNVLGNFHEWHDAERGRLG